MHFLVGALSKVKISFERSFQIKCYKITIKKKLERLGQYLKSQKNVFPIVLSKTDFPWPPF
jgi:hypothetical protein